MTTQELLQTYFKAIHGGGWEAYVADDFTFTNNGSSNVSHGKQAYLEGAGRFFAKTTAVEIKEQVIDGNKAAVLANYTVHSPKGSVGYCEVAEFLTVDGDKLSASTIIFDLKALTEFMQS